MKLLTIFAIIYFVIQPCSVSADPNPLSTGLPPFAERQDGPFRISFFNAPINTHIILNGMDNGSYLKDLDTWIPFHRADIWVYFLEKKSDERMLGKFERDLLEGGWDDNDNFLTRVDINLKEESRKVMVLFLYMNEEAHHLSFNELLCVAVQSIYREISSIESPCVTS